jgi:thiosulfate dehydrogenase [quinone] large subunit
MSTRTQLTRTAPARPTLDSPAARVSIALTRIALGFVYLWAFLDKLFGLGLATPPKGSVLAGQSASAGYLSHTEGALSGWFQSLAGNPIVDALFMLGLGGVGAALIAGVGLRLAALGGTLVMGGIYLSMLPLSNNPIVDDHLIYILLGWLLAAIGAGSVGGLGARWQSLPLVRERRWLY